MNQVHYRAVLALAALALPAAAHAQWADDTVTGGGSASADGGAYGQNGADGETANEPRRGDGRGQRQRPTIQPYIEVSQIVLAELSPGDDVSTGTQLAAGVDASLQGRNHGLSASVRYDYTIGEDSGSVDSSTLTGVARGYAAVIPDTLNVEAGGLAARTRVDAAGGSTLNPGGRLDDTQESRIYSVYAGPTLSTRSGPVQIGANYRFGYNRVEAPDVVPGTVDGTPPVDLFDESTVHSANANLGTRPGTVLPVGLGVGGGFYQEDISNLDQRVRDAHVRGDVTVPLTAQLAAVGGIGYENVEISNRDVVRGDNGLPAIGPDGRYVTDRSAPRQIAFEADGLIWDVGVIWRPSRRTAFEAHYGRRYDSDTYYGSFSYTPDSRSSLNIGAYDAVTGFGGLVNSTLANLPDDFAVGRNPVSGELTGCVTSTQDGGGCLGGALASVRSSVFRSRGIAGSYTRQIGRMTAGLGIGYDRRKFIAAPGTILASANGVIDESYYVSAGLSGPVGRNAGFSLNGYGAVVDAGGGPIGDATVLGASAAYHQYLLGRLAARAAVAIDYLDSKVVGDDLTTASALVGLRYDF